MIYVIGHRNPDTDSVCASIALAEFLALKGEDTIPCVNGTINPETNFVLEKFGLETPEKLEDGRGKKVFLVDHTEISQSLDNLEEAEIKGIVDHHKLGDITTTKPLEAWIWPVGSTCTIIKSMYDFLGYKINKGIAGAMLSAILSDTVVFKSSTCTEQDKKAAKELAKIAGIDEIKDFGIELFKVKSDIDNSKADELIQRDYKDYDMNGNKVGISQLELVDIGMADKIRNDLFEELNKLKEDGRHTVMLLLTDIMKEGSEMLVISDDKALIEDSLGEKIKDSKAWLQGTMSRKKQVVPPLEKAFSKC